MEMKVLVALLGALALGSASAQVYKSVGPDGKVVVTNVPPAVKAAAPVRPASLSSAPHNGSETLAPEVVSALANVMGMSHLVNSARDFCVATMPASLKRYSAAAIGWQQRNAVVVAKKNRVLSMSDRNLMASAMSGDMQRMTEDMLRPIRRAGTAEKIEWCDKALGDVDRGMLDLGGRASIAPLMSYTLR